MNQADFMGQLRQELARNGQNDIDDILSDFTEHFANALANGKNEAEIAQELGDPAEIAAQYVSDQPERKTTATRVIYKRNDMPGTVVDDPGNVNRVQGAANPVNSEKTTAEAYVRADAAANTSPPPQPVYVEKANNRGWIGALLFILNLFVVLPLMLTVFGIVLSLWLGASGLGIAAGALFIAAIVKAGFVSIILVMFGLSLASLTILAFIGVYFLTKLVVLGLIHYIRWNKQVISGGAAA